MRERALQNYLLNLDKPPNLEGIQAMQEQSALRTALSDAQHWFNAYQKAQKELIAVDDAQKLWSNGRGPTNLRMASIFLIVSGIINLILAWHIL